MPSIFKKLLQTDQPETATSPVPSKVKAAPSAASGGPVSVTAAEAVPADLRHILRRPVITEKSSAAMSKNQYVFQVARAANKITIARAIHAAYGVTPIAVRTSLVKAKHRTRGRISGRVAGWKKAVITLPVGKTIRLHDGV